MRGTCVPYRRQILIYAVCANYADMPPKTREKIDRLCAAAGEYSPALREVLIGGKSLQLSAMDHHCDPSTLWRRRKRFYESW